MTPNNYQQSALSTFLHKDAHYEQKLEYLLLGLASEVGELCGKRKKEIRDAAIFDPSEACLELGDILWYLSCLADTYGFSLETVMQVNINKLKDRKARNTIQGSGDHR